LPANQFGWDLPPGVSLHHIPGNRPEDLEDEAFWEEMYKQFKEHGVSIPDEIEDSEWFTRAIEVCRDMAFNRGYKQGQSDEQWIEQETAMAKDDGSSGD
jgi:hypothetical protein